MSNTNITKVDLSHNYARGSFMATVTFAMFGITFVARHFVRTDSCACNVYELYIKHESSWVEDFVKYINPAQADKVDARALHLLSVADAEIPCGVAKRFEQIELY